ncbi:MAG TPA: putative ABC exporter domain-containing protein [Gemmatimonadales bacterium]|nr:putative ABC exporter domain-containing protein [Gemmatimonadales bacterium]
MIRAALFLFRATLRNRARQLLRRVRSPRYVLALLLGGGYLWLVLVWPGGAPAGGAVAPGAAEAIGTALFAVLALKWWVLGADRQALAFTPAEVQFLFPAPLSRAALIRYKLLRAQLPIALSVLVWAVLLRRPGAGSDLAWWQRGASLYLFFATLFLHRLGTALTRDALLSGRWTRRLGALAIAGAAGGAAIGALWFHLPALEAAAARGHEALFGALGRVVASPPLAWLVWPFRVALRPLSAGSAGEWFGALPPALLVLALHLAWVLRADRAFEEAAVEASLRRAERLERRRRRFGGQRPAARRLVRFLPLAPAGHPVSAIVWKNQVRLLRTGSAAFPVLLALLVLVAALLAMRGEANREFAAVTGTMALSGAVLVTLFGPLWIRNDLRGDLEELVLLRTWPLSGRALVGAEVLSSTLALTAIQLPLVAAGLVALPRLGAGLAGGPVLALGAAFAVWLPAMNLAALTIQNAGALFFPAWVRTEIRPGGIEATGQHILTLGVSALLLLALLLGPGAVAGLVAVTLWSGLGYGALVPAALAGAAGLGLEVFLLLEWLGGHFEGMDPSREG